MKEESIRVEGRNYGLYIALFVALVFILQFFFGFYTYCVIKPKIIQSVDATLEQFKENLLQTIERNKNKDIFYYTLFDRKKRDVMEGSGHDYEEYDDDDDFGSTEDYEVKDVEKFCKNVADNCVRVGLPGYPGLPGIKGEKGDRGIPASQESLTTHQDLPPTTTTASPTTYTLMIPNTTETTKTVTVTETESTSENTTTTTTITTETTSTPSGSTISSINIALCILSIVIVFIN